MRGQFRHTHTHTKNLIIKRVVNWPLVLYTFTTDPIPKILLDCAITLIPIGDANCPTDKVEIKF